MAATEAICFTDPAQPGGFSFELAVLYLLPDFHPLWRYACLLDVARLALQGRAPRP